MAEGKLDENDIESMFDVDEIMSQIDAGMEEDRHQSAVDLGHRYVNRKLRNSGYKPLDEQPIPTEREAKHMVREAIRELSKTEFSNVSRSAGRSTQDRRSREGGQGDDMEVTVVESVSTERREDSVERRVSPYEEEEMDREEMFPENSMIIQELKERWEEEDEGPVDIADMIARRAIPKTVPNIRKRSIVEGAVQVAKEFVDRHVDSVEDADKIVNETRERAMNDADNAPPR